MSFQIPEEHWQFQLFEESWYRARHPEVEALCSETVSAYEAFLTLTECRLHSPGPFFETPHYMSRSDYQADVGIDPITHFLRVGEALGISPHWLFDEAYYRLANPDIRLAIESGQLASGFRHFISDGFREQRRPHPLFCASTFATANAFRQYLLNWQFEERSPSPLFDAEWYRGQTDVVTGISERYTSLLHHFLSAGMDQGLICCPEFDAEFYLQSHPQLTGWAEAVRHWLFSGCADGADPNPHFNGEYYLRANPLVHSEMVELGLASEFEHFLLRGRNLGLRCSAPRLMMHNQLADDSHSYPHLEVVVEEVRGAAITGYAYDPSAPDRVFVVEFSQGERFLGTTRADSYHASHGGHGFVMPLSDSAVSQDGEVQIRLAGQKSIRASCRPPEITAPRNGPSIEGALQQLGQTLQHLDAAMSEIRGKLENLKQTVPAGPDRFAGIHALHRNRIPWGGVEHYRLLLSGRISRMASRRLVTLVVDTRSARIDELEQTLSSISAQIYPVWETRLIADPAADEAMAAFLEEKRRADSRFQLLQRPKKADSALALGAATADAEGKYLGFIDPGDTIEYEALALMLLESQDQRPALIYCDEVLVGASAAEAFRPWFKPDFDYWQLLQWNYIGGLALVEREALHAAGGFNPGLCGLHFHDLWLRLYELRGRKSIRHLPRVLYQRRARPGNPANATQQAFHLGQIIGDHLQRQDINAAVAPRSLAGLLTSGVAPRPGDAQPRVTIIVPTHRGIDTLANCISSVLERTEYENYEILLVDHDPEPGIHRDFTAALAHHPKVSSRKYTGPFNWARMNNEAVAASDGEILCFLNNDTVVFSSNWLTELVGQVMQPGTGVAGPLLLYPDGSIQHAGVVTGISGAADHAFKGLRGDDPGYARQASMRREVSAVTGACLVCRRDLFDALDGFDGEQFAVTFNDVDFCLRARANGEAVVFVPGAVLYHHESKTRGTADTPEKIAKQSREADVLRSRWPGAMRADPYYSPYWEPAAPSYTSLRVPPELDCETLSADQMQSSSPAGTSARKATREGKLVLFVHIPKTAGTSFKAALIEAYGQEAMVEDYADLPGTSPVIRKFNELDDPSELKAAISSRDITFLCGHYPVARYLQIFPDAAVVTFLRDPIQRLMSEYVHRKFRQGLDADWDTFTRDEYFHNLQSKQLRGIALDDIAFLGVTERYAESLQLFSAIMQRELPVRMKNAAVRDLDEICALDPPMIERLEQKHASDRALYEHANSIIDARLALLEASR